MYTPRRYDHLGPLALELDFDVLAEKVAAANYGSLRFLEALIRAERRRESREGKFESDLSDGIEKLLEAGKF